jgi:hypothetical protein
MKKRDSFLTAEHPTRGTLWAAFDGAAHHLQGRVAERRFPAFLSPFKSEQDARAALVSEGCSLE